SKWVADKLSPEVPVHFTAFHPDFKMTDRPATPAATLRRARAIAHNQGLRHVYTGNIRNIEGASTYCTACGTCLIQRDGYAILRYRLRDDGCCIDCGSQLAGRFQHFDGSFGNKRIPIRLAR
ncbi:MAG: AmmeMemoRadiSam system radical SAM enzyme, partial [Burkholderiales bacterium]|nr:AmmeMemoRadiSam system radical SAM enzyme [Anaerolineae bacterium]